MEKEKIQFSSTDKKLYILVGIIIVVVIIMAIWSVNRSEKEKWLEDNENITEEELEEDTNRKLIAALQEMEERDRMEYYFDIFLNDLENKDYEKAYSVLYEEFRNTYFPTLEDFKNYIPKLFSEMVTIEHTNIERSGDVYILWLTIGDAINGKPGEEKEWNVVMKENDYNDFVLSFSVI